jgi:hypothetical protein
MNDRDVSARWHAPLLIKRPLLNPKWFARPIEWGRLVEPQPSPR